MSGKWKKENVVLVDHESTDSDEYLSGLKDATNLDWGVISSVANQGRGTVMGSIARYAKYFWFPFIAFLHRNRFKNVIGWQAFYGINLAFFEKLFRVKKTHTLTIQHFIYKKKSGFLGFVYDRYIHYAVDSRYVDLLLASQIFSQRESCRLGVITFCLSAEVTEIGAGSSGKPLIAP